MPPNSGHASRGCLHELCRHSFKAAKLTLVSYTFCLLFHVSLQKWQVEVQEWRDIDQKTQIGQECDMTWGSPWLGFKWWPGGNDHQEETYWHHRWWGWGLIRAQSTRAPKLSSFQSGFHDQTEFLCTNSGDMYNSTTVLNCPMGQVQTQPDYQSMQRADPQWQEKVHALDGPFLSQIVHLFLLNFPHN